MGSPDNAGEPRQPSPVTPGGPWPLGLFDHDLRNGSREWDGPMLAMFGYGPSDLGPEGDGFGPHVHPEDRARVDAAVQLALAGAVPDGAVPDGLEVELRVRLPEGGRRRVAVRARVLRDADGTAVRLLGAAVDVSDLRRGQTLAEQVLQHMSVGYAALDADWRVSYVNAEAVALLARAREDLVGGVLWDLFPGTVGTDFETRYRGAVATGRAVTFDSYYPPPLDAWYEVRAVPEGTGLGLYFLDITARVTAQRTAERSGGRLAALGGVALSLADARDVTDLVTTMAEQGLAALGADGGAVAVPDPDEPGMLQSYITASYGPGTRASFDTLPVDAALPACEAFRTGRRVLVRDLAAALAYSPAMQQVVELTGSPVYASVPMRAGGRVVGVLTAGWEQEQPFDAEQLELLETVAAQCAQALQRLHARDTERAATAAARRSAEQQAALVALAMALARADTAEAVARVVSGAVTEVPTEPVEQEDGDLLEAVAALQAQALGRIGARDAERSANLAVAQFSEALQRSLLSGPPPAEHLQIAVRYSPAAAEAEVGGDWYDAFVTSQGVMSLVIGDVTGHDRHAAAAMAQLRNLLRGIAYAVREPPAAVLALVDRALDDLAVGAMATVVVAQVEAAQPDSTPTDPTDPTDQTDQTDQTEQTDPAAGRSTLRWSNAGHLPPLLVSPDGTVAYLTTEPELLLGVDPGRPRTDHEVVLEPGAVALLFTDGLVERRGAHLQEGLDWLAGTVGALAHLPLDDLCDALLAQVGTRVEDDVALLAVSARPAVHPAPEAGETVVLEHPSEVRRARELVRRVCEAAGVDAGTTETAVLLSSEVVTNAVLHGGGRARLRVWTGPQDVRVEVGDDSRQHPRLAPPDLAAQEGRGVGMVDLLATAWGTREESDGKAVWFTLARG